MIFGTKILDRRTMIPHGIIAANIELMRQHPGVMVECGVWKGGMMAKMMKIADHVIGYDSFEGLPEPKNHDGKTALEYANNKSSPAYYDNCKAGYDDVYNYLLNIGGNFKLVKGWYSPELFNDCTWGISVLRIDCDWHDSVKVVLENLFPKVKTGGLVIIDDYKAYDGCALAVNSFMSKTSIRLREYKGVTYFNKTK